MSDLTYDARVRAAAQVLADGAATFYAGEELDEDDLLWARRAFDAAEIPEVIGLCSDLRWKLNEAVSMLREGMADGFRDELRLEVEAALPKMQSLLEARYPESAAASGDTK